MQNPPNPLEDESVPATTHVTPADSPTIVADRPALSLKKRGLWRDLFEMVTLVVIIYTLVNLTTARAYVEGPSMQPNFYTGQLVIVNLFAYYFTSPARGDVVVLHNPEPQCKDVVKANVGLAFLLPGNQNGTCDDFIKRIIGLPGDNVEIKAGGHVFINGKMLEEPYIASFCERGCEGKWKLGPDQYFILGDNRPASYDSHSFGPINRSLLVGEAWIRYWPLPEFKVIPHPDYGVIPTAAP